MLKFRRVSGFLMPFRGQELVRQLSPVCGDSVGAGSGMGHRRVERSVVRIPGEARGVPVTLGRPQLCRE